MVRDTSSSPASRCAPWQSRTPIGRSFRWHPGRTSSASMSRHSATTSRPALRMASKAAGPWSLIWPVLALRRQRRVDITHQGIAAGAPPRGSLDAAAALQCKQGCRDASVGAIPPFRGFDAKPAVPGSVDRTPETSPRGAATGMTLRSRLRVRRLHASFAACVNLAARRPGDTGLACPVHSPIATGAITSIPSRVMPQR